MKDFLIHTLSKMSSDFHCCVCQGEDPELRPIVLRKKLVGLLLLHPKCYPILKKNISETLAAASIGLDVILGDEIDPKMLAKAIGRN